MKLHKILNENEQMVDEIEHYLQTETFSPEVEQALSNIPDSLWNQLCRHPLLMQEVDNSYDYASDSGVTFTISDDAIMTALEEVSGR